jgi:hypothetical protein
MRRFRANRGGDVFRCRKTGAAPDDAAFLIDHTDMRQLLWDIQTDELFHEQLHHMGLLRILTGGLRTVGARPQLPHVTGMTKSSFYSQNFAIMLIAYISAVND